MKHITRAVLSLSLLMTVGFYVNAFAAEEAPAGPSRELTEIKGRLENIEKQQQELSAKDDKILEELDRLRVWVRRK
ncbi:MAG TPA: hypothetical protein PLL75_06400 [Candidatus Omnitrophota bacterium]|nr:hypothetical protein [Candidatus Omnitrophota bacterium]HPS37339.1 hypothetical protein [Candidatus Omnitrophota bacterium]